MNEYLHDEDVVFAYLAGWEAPQYYILELSLQFQSVVLVPYCDLSVLDKIKFTNYYARRGDLGKVKHLHDLGFPVVAKGFCKAIKSGNLELVKWLVEQGCPFRSNSISKAYKHGHFHIVQWMLSVGFNDYYTTVRKIRNLEDCEKYSHRMHITEYVIKHNILELFPKYANLLPNTTLSWALEYSNTQILKSIDLRQVDSYMVEIAAEHNNLKYLKMLLSLYLDKVRTRHYKKIFKYFAEYGNLKAIKYLHKKLKLIRPEAVDAAFKCGHVKVVKYCLQYSKLRGSSAGYSVKPNVEYLKIAEEIGYENFASLFINAGDTNFDKDIRIIKWVQNNVVGSFALFFHAIRRGYIHTIKRALDNNEINEDDIKTGVQRAHLFNMNEIYKLLSSKTNLKLNIKNSHLDFNTDITPSHWHFSEAIRNGMIQELEWCFNHSCPIDDPIKEAAETNCGKSIRFLLKKGYKIEGRNDLYFHPALFLNNAIAKETSQQ